MDAFTRRHLAAWIAENVWAEDAGPFGLWVADELADDPGLADLGWPRLYSCYQQLYV